MLSSPSSPLPTSPSPSPSPPTTSTPPIHVLSTAGKEARHLTPTVEPLLVPPRHLDFQRPLHILLLLPPEQKRLSLRNRHNRVPHIYTLPNRSLQKRRKSLLSRRLDAHFRQESREAVDRANAADLVRRFRRDVWRRRAVGSEELVAQLYERFAGRARRRAEELHEHE